MVITSQVFRVIGCPHNHYVYITNETIYGEEFEIYKCDQCGHSEYVKVVE